MSNNIPALASDHAAQRKRMRKGTRSCLECRTRKIRCIFANNSRICNSCKAQGKTCVEQTYKHVREAGLDKRVGLKERVKELEALVHQLVEKGNGDKNVVIPERYKKRLEERRDSSTFGNDMLSPSDSERSGKSSPLRSTARLAQDAIADIYDAVDDIDDGDNESYAPDAVRSLFDNSIISHDRSQRPPTVPPVCNRKSKALYDRLSKELRALVPSREDLKSLCGEDMVYEPIWRQTLTPDVEDDNSTMESILYRFFESESLTSVCKGLLYFALLLQQLPADRVREKLGFPEDVGGKALIQVYINIVEEYLTSSDQISGTLEGMECNLIVAHLLTNDGRPRKAWIWSQRTIANAKLLGYHRSSSWKTPDVVLGKRREKLFWTLYQADRLLSLLLGLPYSILDQHVDVCGILDSQPSQNGIDVPTFTRRLAVINGRIIDRNQSSERETAETLTTAMQLEGELHALACMVPGSFWNTAPNASPNEPLLDAYFRSKAVFWFCECRLMLHTPFMMKHLQKSDSSSMFAYNRTIALNSARTIIRTHTHLRNRPELVGIVCQVLDFQVFTSAMLLLLDMIERPDVGKERQEPQTIEDSELIITVIGTLTRISKETSGRCDIAGQAVKVLSSVAHVLYGCPAPNEQHPSRVVIPYFGAVTIKPVGTRKKCKCCPPVETTQPITPQSFVDSSSTNGPGTESTGAGQLGDTPASSDIQSGYSTLQTYNTSDFVSFDSFIGAGQGMAFNCGQEAWSLPGGSENQQFAEASEGQDVAMWDTSLWQNMLESDPSIELDGDWNWLPQVQT